MTIALHPEVGSRLCDPQYGGAKAAGSPLCDQSACVV